MVLETYRFWEEIPAWTTMEFARCRRFAEKLDALLATAEEESADELLRYPQHFGGFASVPEVRQIFQLRTDCTHVDYLIAGEMHAEISRLLPAIVWSSLFLSMTAFTEHAMLELARALDVLAYGEARLRRAAKAQDTKTHLTTKLALLPSDADEWRLIEKYRALRNVLAHRSGLVLDDDESARGEDIRASGVTVNEHGYVMLDRYFVEQAIADYQSFFTWLFDAVPEWLSRGRS